LHAATMNALEFPKVQQALASYAACQLGKELAQALKPLASVTLIKQAQKETTEAKAIIRRGVAIPFGGIVDVRYLLRRAENGGVLRPDDLTAIAQTTHGCRLLHAFLVAQAEVAPSLVLKGAAFGRFDKLEDEILRCIEHGTVADRASRDLKQIRREISVVETRIQDRLQSLLKQAGVRQHLQEAIVTQRDGRWVIPVRSASRAAVTGAVRGASASGATLFVEPDAVRALSEELEHWKALEEAEVEKVLIALSALVAAEADPLLGTLEAVAELDLIFAKGRLSYAWDAGPVEWNDAGLIDLKGARHPLLGKEAVGNRIRLATDAKLLIVTGPNTGGKTLLLKSLGLLVIMAHAGLHIPVEDGSTLCHLRDVCADIGDSQSLEQSLSTFSGHIANVAPILATADARTLVLLDELGSGTDPHEGTGLGIALLEAFMARGAYTLATTHLREIKEFGRLTPGCTIAGMGFDGETLRPTYRLIYGALGESQGLVIAARAGLPVEVVERAHQLVHGGGFAGAPQYRAAAENGVADRSRRAGAGTELYAAPDVIDLPTERLVLRREKATPVEVAGDYALVVSSPLPGRCRVWTGTETVELPVKGTLRRKLHGGLVVGDRVRVAGDQVVDAAKRSSYLARRSGGRGEQIIAANLTRLLIVLSCKAPDFRANILDRHLVYAEQYGIAPIICLTKGDLVKPSVWQEWLKPYEAMGYTCVVTSSEGGWGIEKLRELLQGQTTAVLGHSGVGKSTLLAAVTGRELVTGAVREAGKQTGQHTTTWSEAIAVNEDTWVVDTPGLRALGFWKLTLPDLQRAFREFGQYAGICRFDNCSHTHEPGCGVRLAVEQGQVARRRYEHYVKLAAEVVR
jgi:DNA mismatch repair protein MutS2